MPNSKSEAKENFCTNRIPLVHFLLWTVFSGALSASQILTQYEFRSQLVSSWLHASMSVSEAASTSRGTTANPIPVGSSGSEHTTAPWTVQGCTHHYNRLQQTPLMLDFLGGWKEDAVLSLVPSSPGTQQALTDQKVPFCLPRVPFPHCITSSLEKCTAASWPRNDRKQSWQSHLLHPQLKGLIQPIHDISVSVSLEDLGLPTVF